MAKDDTASVRFEMRASPSWLAALDEWRRKQPDIPGRAEAIRRLVGQSLQGGRYLKDTVADVVAAQLEQVVAQLEGMGLRLPSILKGLEQAADRIRDRVPPEDRLN